LVEEDEAVTKYKERGMKVLGCVEKGHMKSIKSKPLVLNGWS